MTLADREDAYKKTMDLVDALTPAELANDAIYRTSMSTRFFYADFLMTYDTGREEEIRTILAPFGSASRKGLTPGSEYGQTHAARLADISADLAAYLKYAS